MPFSVLLKCMQSYSLLKNAQSIPSVGVTSNVLGLSGEVSYMIPGKYDNTPYLTYLTFKGSISSCSTTNFPGLRRNDSSLENIGPSSRHYCRPFGALLYTVVGLARKRTVHTSGLYGHSIEREWESQSRGAASRNITRVFLNMGLVYSQMQLTELGDAPLPYWAYTMVRLGKRKQTLM